MSLPPTGILLDGVSAADACKRLEDAGAAVVGLNCGMGPPTMLHFLKEIANVCKVKLCNEFKGSNYHISLNGG